MMCIHNPKVIRSNRPPHRRLSLFVLLVCVIMSSSSYNIGMANAEDVDTTPAATTTAEDSTNNNEGVDSTSSNNDEPKKEEKIEFPEKQW